MGQLDASFHSSGKAANVVEVNDSVQIVLTSPPAAATDVRIQLLEKKDTGDAQSGERLLATFRGHIDKQKFTLDGPSGDPLDVDPKPNPELNDALKKEMSDAPPTVKITFNPGDASSSVPLPDKLAEGLQYEIRLKITGTIGGKAETFDGAAILNVRLAIDVMIVPDVDPNSEPPASGDRLIFWQNARFGFQWKAFAPARRELLKIPVDGALTDFENAVTAAASKAKKSEVLLCIGHGGAGGFRGLSLTVFDTVPESVHGMNLHKHTITSDVLNLPERAERKSPGKWVPKAKTPSSQDQTEIDALAPRFEVLERLAVVLKNGQVSRFVVMSCNFARDAQFGNRLSTLLKTPVGGFDRLLAMADVVSSNPGEPKHNVQAWLVADENNPSANRPPDSDITHRSFHEVPSPLRNFSPSP
ncbi:MAG: hypothetical protein IT581_08710 [Verrucomicrobiales bacterium]|nr:hypothetical protein [Verrucomicrobiales bacterium]